MSFRSNHFISRGITGAVSALALGAAMSGAAFAQEDEVRSFNIEAKPLSQALIEYSRQSEIDVIAPSSLTRGVTAVPVLGELSTHAALEQLIGGADLEMRVQSDGSIVLAQAVVEEDEPADASFLVAEVDEEAAERGVTTPVEEVEDAELRQDQITVTGTNIRGVGDQFSPVTTFDRGDFDAAGFNAVSDLVTALPQNFRTNTNPASSAFAAGSSTINLRGLGEEATLTLLNGRRVAPGGLRGSSVDVSSIPVSALERVEVLTDGASAIYGSDAVAGVVNFVLREDYNGNETRLRFGTLTEGDGDLVQFGHTFGRSGVRGRILASYEYSSGDGLDANDKSFAEVADDPSDLLPASDRHGGFISAGWNFSERIELVADAYFNSRESEQKTTFGIFRTDATAKAEQAGGSLGLNIDFNRDWQLRLAGAFGQNEFDNSVITRVGDDTNINSARVEDTSTDVWSFDIAADGPIFELGGGMARAVIGAQYREETHDGFRTFLIGNDLAPSGFFQARADTNRSVSAGFVELYLPFVGEANRMTGVEALAVSLAGRYEDYSDFGSTFNPKIGLNWSPMAAVTLRGTYGTSFRAPRLQQLVNSISSADLVDYVDPASPSGTTPALWIFGENGSELGPEESNSWTVGFDFEPKALPGLLVRTTYYEIDYEDRIANPRAVVSSAGRISDFSIPVERIDGEAAQALADQAGRFINSTARFPGLSNSSLADVTTLLDNRPTNTAASRINGLDVQLSYAFDWLDSDWSLSTNGAYIFDAEDQFSETLPPVTRVDTVFEPADLRLRSSLSWQKGDIGAVFFANYVDDYIDDQNANGDTKVDSWLTFDASIHYDFGERFEGGVLAGTRATLSVRNLFDEAPPAIDQTVAAGGSPRRVLFDSANADPQGRAIALQITKAW